MTINSEPRSLLAPGARSTQGNAIQLTVNTTFTSPVTALEST